MRKQITPVVITNTGFQLGSGQLACRLNDGFLAVHPVWFNPIEPRTLDWQLAEQDPNFALPLRHSVVLPEPVAHHLRDVPTGIVPNQQQRFLAFGLQLFGQPLEEGDRDARNRTAFDKTQAELSSVCTQQAVTSQRLWIGIALLCSQFLKPQRFALSPSVQLRLRQARPPDLILITQDPLGMSSGQANQPVTRLFLRAYA